MQSRSIRLFGVPLLALLMFAGVPMDAARQPGGVENSTAGRLLVATPDLQDPNFRETVVYMIRHDRNGAMGLVINRRIGSGPLDKLLEGFGSEARSGDGVEIEIFSGGPVERERGFLLHSTDYRNADTLVLSDEVAMTSSPEVLEDMAAGRGPERSLFAVGYAGWAPRQLESELAAGAWYVVDSDPALLFDGDVDGKWQRAVDRRGVDL